MRNLNFNVKVYLTNPGVLPELQYRSAHLAPAYDAIFLGWTKLNEQKFEQSVELNSLVLISLMRKDGLLSLRLISKQSIKREQLRSQRRRPRAARLAMKALSRTGLVRTGALRAAMINPDALFHDISDDYAMFGTPIDSTLAIRSFPIWRETEA